MTWTALHVVPSANRDAVIAALFDAGSQGIHEDGASIVTHFPPETDISGVRAAILDVDANAEITIAPTQPVSYDVWRANVHAHTIGQITVCPPWLADEHPVEHTVVIDPAMAFGTGEHPTTRGVIRLMQEVVSSATTVADLGAGSAVLSIAAAKLGAPRVTAIELDPDATSNAQENIARNAVSVHYIEGDAALLLPLLAPVDVVLANIISSVLIELLPVIGASLSLSGQAILSGILVEERSAMLDAFARENWTVIAEDTEEQWWSVRITRPA